MTTPDKNMAQSEQLPDSDRPAADEPLAADERPVADPAAGATAPVRSKGQRLRSGSASVLRSRWTQLVAALLIGVVVGGGVVGLVGTDEGRGDRVQTVQSESAKHGDGHRGGQGDGERAGRRAPGSLENDRD